MVARPITFILARLPKPPFSIVSPPTMALLPELNTLPTVSTPPSADKPPAAK